MRLIIIGTLEGFISQAGKIALQKGAKVIHCEDTEQAIGALLNGKGADLASIWSTPHQARCMATGH